MLVLGSGGVLITLTLVTQSIKGLFNTWIFSLNNFFSSESITYSIDKFKDPKHFEDEFGRLIRTLKIKRLVVIFDNLDRVPDKKALEVLSTIKTFLEPKDLEINKKEVVFLIPCDANAIRAHINNIYGTDRDNKAFETEEFLRKFFNTVLTIPDFIKTELESYAGEQLSLTNVPALNNPKIAWIITKAYRNNPRQIIQFVNILLGNYLLIKEREGEGKDFHKNFLNENILQLTTYLLLSELFPEEMNEVREKQIIDVMKAEKNLTTPKKTEFQDFVNETSLHIKIKDIRVFFTLRRSELEKIFVGIEDFFSSCVDNKVDEAKDFLLKIDLKTNKEVFSNVVKQRLYDISNEVSLISTISTLLNALNDINEKLSESAYGEIYEHLINKLPKLIDTIKPSSLSNQIIKPFRGYRHRLISLWLNVIYDLDKEKGDHLYKPQKNYIEEVFNELIPNPKWISNKNNKLKETISNQISNFWPWFPELIIKYPNSQLKFLNQSSIVNFINTFDPDDNGTSYVRDIELTFILNIDETLLNESHFASLLLKLSKLQDHENSIPFDNERETIKSDVVDFTHEFIKNFKQYFSSIDPTTVDQLTNSVVASVSGAPTIDSQKIFIPLLLDLQELSSDQTNPNTTNIINAFFQSSNVDSLNWVIKKAKHLDIIENSPFSQIFENRALADQNIFDNFYNQLSNYAKSSWLSKLCDTDIHRLLTKIAELKYKFPNKPELTKKLISKTESIPELNSRRQIFEAINELKCPGDAEQKNNLAGSITRHLFQPDQNYQQIGHDSLKGASYLNKTRKRKIIKDVFDNLRKPEVAEKYQPLAIRSISLGYIDGILNNEEQNEFLQFIFEELIKKSTNIQTITFGFDILSSLNPKYKDRNFNFEDIKIRYESESDENIKSALASGLKNLTFNDSDKFTKSYKAFVDSI